MENEIYQILKKHKLPLKKREEVLNDLLLLLSVVEQSEQFCGCEHEDSRGKIDGLCKECWDKQ